MAANILFSFSGMFSNVIQLYIQNMIARIDRSKLKCVKLCQEKIPCGTKILIVSKFRKYTLNYETS